MKKEQIFKILNYFLIAIMIIGSTTLGINYFYYKAYIRILTTLTIIITIFIPIVLRNTRFRLSQKDKFIYYLFIFIAHFLGAIMNLYKRIIYYDLFVHFISGMVFFYISYLILVKTNSHQYKNKLINFLYFLGVVSFSALVWEILEFSGDILLNNNFQHSIDTGIIDTMGDMIAALFGGLISYLIYLKSNKSNQ